MTIHLSPIFYRIVSVLALGVIASALAQGALFAQSSRGDAPVSPRGNVEDRDDFFADPSLRVFQIELSEVAMESLRRSSNTYVSGTVREGAHVFTNVGIHLKGLGSFQPLERKPSFVVRFNESGRGRPEGWHEELVIGEPVMDQRADGRRSALRIVTRDGRCRASWRAMVYLQPGRYRFEGRVRTEGLNRGTVGLRISGDPEYRRLAGASVWQELTHEFEVKEVGRDVDLVCESDAYAGTVWFDLDSLFVRKL